MAFSFNEEYKLYQPMKLTNIIFKIQIVKMIIVLVYFIDRSMFGTKLTNIIFKIQIVKMIINLVYFIDRSMFGTNYISLRQVTRLGNTQWSR